jgi:hypothetical protein
MIERPMIIRMPTASRPQQRYDHLLRDLVQRCRIDATDALRVIATMIANASWLNTQRWPKRSSHGSWMTSRHG